MATYYLIRHGEADYDNLMDFKFFGFGRDLAPLTEKGIKQAEETSRDERLKSADIIISSPYTRALQTAQIISKNTGIAVQIELGLHEWIPDLTNQYTESEESFALAREFTYYHGEYPASQQMKWECLSDMRARMKQVADKYADYNKVIIVSHGMALRTITYIGKMKPAEIIECEYFRGQINCEYSFC